MSFIWKGIVSLFKTMPKFAKFIPIGIGGLFVITQFFFDWARIGLAPAFAHLSQSVLAAELTINRVTHLAIQNSPEYTFGAFISLVVAILILYSVIKWITRIQVKVGGAQAVWGAFAISLLIVGAIEMATIRVIDGTFGFIPFKDGIFFLLVNLPSVLGNIGFLGG